MKVFLASEFRCTVCNGKYYLAPKAYNIYKRYADAFGNIVLCSRFEYTSNIAKGYLEADFIHETIEINNLLHVLIGKYNYIIRTKIDECDLVILRLPSMIGYNAGDCAYRLHKPILAEQMADPWDGYWNHSVLGKMIAPYMFFKMKNIVKNANYALYVTKEFLQKRYPCKNLCINASNVVIHDVNNDVLEKRVSKIRGMSKNNISLMTTAGVNVKAKGHRFVINAIRELKKDGIEITYYLAGGGDQRTLKRLAQKKGVENSVVFLGELSMPEVYEWLDKTDIYIQPSLQEGLPRAVIEAMSRGCPCLGSNTAGTPELLQDECIFRRGSSKAVIKAIKNMLGLDLVKVARTNFEISKEYKDDFLDERRKLFFDKIKSDIKR